MLALRHGSIKSLEASVTFRVSLLRADGLLSEDELYAKAIVYLVLLGVFNCYQGVLEVHNGALQAH